MDTYLNKMYFIALLQRVFTVLLFFQCVIVVSGVFNDSIILTVIPNDLSPSPYHIAALPYDIKDSRILTEQAEWISFSDKTVKYFSCDIDYSLRVLYMYDRPAALIVAVNNFDFSTELSKTSLVIFQVGMPRTPNVKIAVDWISHNVYWTDPINGRIIMQTGQLKDIDKSQYKIIIGKDLLKRPFGLAVDPIHGFLFWSDVGKPQTIGRSSLTGKNRKTLISTKLGVPISIVVDLVDSRIFWVDSFKDTIESADFEGRDRKTIRTIPRTSMCDIAVFKNIVMVVDKNKGHMRTFNKESGEEFVFSSSKGKFSSVTMYSLQTQPHKTNYCANASCIDMCVSGSNGAECLCREGHQGTCSGENAIFNFKGGATTTSAVTTATISKTTSSSSDTNIPSSISSTIIDQTITSPSTSSRIATSTPTLTSVSPIPFTSTIPIPTASDTIISSPVTSNIPIPTTTPTITSVPITSTTATITAIPITGYIPITDTIIISATSAPTKLNHFTITTTPTSYTSYDTMEYPIVTDSPTTTPTPYRASTPDTTTDHTATSTNYSSPITTNPNTNYNNYMTPMTTPTLSTTPKTGNIFPLTTTAANNADTNIRTTTVITASTNTHESTFPATTSSVRITSRSKPFSATTSSIIISSLSTTAHFLSTETATTEEQPSIHAKANDDGEKPQTSLPIPFAAAIVGGVFVLNLLIVVIVVVIIKRPRANKCCHNFQETRVANLQDISLVEHQAVATNVNIIGSDVIKVVLSPPSLRSSISSLNSTIEDVTPRLISTFKLKSKSK